MPKPQISTLKRFFPFGWDREYLNTFKLEGFQLSLLAQNLIKILILDLISEKQPLINLKGRDPSSLLSNPGPARNSLPVLDELLYLDGHFITNQKSLTQGQPFSLRISTPFHSFEGDHKILHQVKIETSGFEDLSTSYITKNIAQMIGLELSTLRIGLELFESKRNLLLGFTPVVKQTLAIEADQTKVQVQIKAEGLPSANSLPLIRNDILDKLDLALKLAGVQVEVGIRQELE